MKFKKLAALSIFSFHLFGMELVLFQQQPININLSEALSKFEQVNPSNIDLNFEYTSPANEARHSSRDFFNDTQDRLNSSYANLQTTVCQEIYLPLNQKKEITQYLTKQFNNALRNFNNVLGRPDDIKTIQSAFNLNKFTTPIYPQLNALINETAYKLQQYLFNSSGDFIGKKTNSFELIQKIIQNFKIQGEALLQSIPFDLNQDNIGIKYTSKDLFKSDFNKDLYKIIELFKKDDFHSAHNIVQKYRKNYGLLNDFRHLMEELYRAEFQKIYSPLGGIRNEFKNHPNAMKYLIESGTDSVQELPNDSVNQRLISEAQQTKQLLQYHGAIDTQNVKVLEITHNLDSLRHNNIDLVEYLADNVSADHQNPLVQQAYNIFYTPEGTPKLIPLLSIDLKKIDIPVTIGNMAHAQDRVSLFKFATTPILNNLTHEVVRKGIGYVIEACKERECWQSFSNLARDVADALYYIDTDKSILTTGDYTSKCNDLTLKNKVVPFVTDIADCLWYDRPFSPPEKNFFKSSLKIIDTFWQGLTEHNNSDCATSLAWILEDRDNALHRTRELATAAHELKQLKIEECFTIDPHNVVGITKELQHIPTLTNWRSDFLEQLKSNPASYVKAPKIEKMYNLSTACQKFLDEQSINKELFKKCRGTELQQKLHNEFVNIAHISENLHSKIKTPKDESVLTTHAVRFAEVGCGYNHHNQLQKSITLANTCWGLLDCAIGVAEGLGQGLQNIGNLVAHPLESAANIATSIGMVGHGVVKVLEMAHLIEAIQKNLDTTGKYATRLHKLESQLNEISTAIEKKLSELTIRDLARESTAFVTEVWLTGKLFSGVGKFINCVKKGIEAAKEISTVPKLLAATTEGAKIEVSIAEKIGKQLFNAMEKTKEGLGKTTKAIASSKPIASAVERLKCFQKFEEIFKKGGKQALKELEHQSLGLLKDGNIIKEFTTGIIKEKWDHMFSPKHMREGTMKLGKSQAQISEKVTDIIKAVDGSSLFKLGDNTIKTAINGHESLIRVYIDEIGKVINVDIYRITYKNPRMLGNVIHW